MAGLTVLEMLVSTTCLVIIVLGLTAMFVETQRVFKMGTRQTSMTDSGRTILDMVTSDLAQLSDAQNTNIVNLYWGWAPTNISMQTADGSTVPYRTNQLQEIFMLVRTNMQWVGVGYAVSNYAGGAGTLYRYMAMTNDPLTTNGAYYLYTNFAFGVANQVFSPLYFHRVTDGVVHLKIRAFDTTGNEPLLEQYQDYAVGGASFSYPTSAYAYSTGVPGQTVFVPSAGLPGMVQLEVGVLEPDAFEQLRALPANRTIQLNYLSKAGGKIQIYRQNIPIGEH